jgi:hypothetical protein
MTTEEANKAIELFEEIEDKLREIEGLRTRLHRITNFLDVSDLLYFSYNTVGKYQE